MKSVILSYGHFDPVLPLFVHLNKRTDVDLILIVSQTVKTESLLSFTDIAVEDGFVGMKKSIQILSRIGFEDHYPKIRIFMLHNNKVRSLKNYFLYFRLKKELKNYDLIHFNGQHTTLIPFYYLLPGRVKKIFTVHDYKSHSGESGKYHLFGCLWNNKKILKTNWPVVIQNKLDLSVTQQENPHAFERIHFIPFGIFENYKYWFQPGITNEKYDVLFFGRISVYKGIEYLLKAILKLQQENHWVKLCIAGSGSLDKYKSLIQQIRNVTIFNEYIQNRKLVALIQESKMIVCPYTDATQSGVAMTAYAIGKPVIASSVGGFPEIIKEGKTGFLVPPKDCDLLADAIFSLMYDNPKRLEMRKNISNLYKHSEFGWDWIADNYNQLYHSN